MTNKADRDNGLTGIVFNIQRYSIHDGPGIRTTVFLKGCMLRCYWCQNPESQRLRPEVLLNRSVCTLCGRCVDACTTGAAGLSGASALIDRDKCVGCGKCVDLCPAKARTMAGRYMTVDQVVEEVLRDKPFYDNSGGGVTLSGGDPLMQPEFALQLLRRCKERDLHTTIETCGHASWPTMEGLLQYADLVLLDMKCLDPVKHRQATGKDNGLIIENSRRIAENGRMRVRVPLIPGFNDSVEDVKAVRQFAVEALGLTPSDIDLLRYNNLGEGKYERLDRGDEQPSIQPQTDEYMETLETILV
jgi:pyruvate formate lyase activating enzyme